MASDRVRCDVGSLAAPVSAEDTVLFGYGIESLATSEDRATMLGRALDHLLR